MADHPDGASRARANAAEPLQVGEARGFGGDRGGDVGGGVGWMGRGGEGRKREGNGEGGVPLGERESQVWPPARPRWCGGATAGSYGSHRSRRR